MSIRLNDNFLLALAAFTAAQALGARDPFLPIDYAPPVPRSARPVEAPAPVTPPPRVVAPITQTDWDDARKSLVISGFTKSVRSDTGKTNVLAVINRAVYMSGDTFPFVRQGIRFHWRIDAITPQDVTLTPVKAERIAPADGDSSKNNTP